MGYVKAGGGGWNPLWIRHWATNPEPSVMSIPFMYVNSRGSNETMANLNLSRSPLPAWKSQNPLQKVCPFLLLVTTLHHVA